MIELILSAALLCYSGECHPVLVGTQTPVGEYSLTYRPTRQRGYGGDVLVFHETAQAWYAIHRTWPGREALYGLPAARRAHISKGCINVPPALYERLTEATTLVVRP